MGAIVKVQLGLNLRISCAFLVKKGHKNRVMKYWLCVDLHWLNCYFRKMKIRYEKLQYFINLLKKGGFLVGFDIKNAYHQLRMRQ